VEGAQRVTPVSYPVPWDLVFGLTPYIARNEQRDIDDFTRNIVQRMDPAPDIQGLDRLPADPRFVLVANHYQRKGLWILHTAAALTQAVVARYGPHPAPVRWMVTANWPPWRIGPIRIPSPGDILLPKVAHALRCYPVSFAGSNPAYTARSLRRVLKEARSADRPLGIFPEGVAGAAGRLTDPLPGVDRLLLQLARLGLPVVPSAVSERDGRLVLAFGAAIEAGELKDSHDAARLSLRRVKDLLAAVG
jgi:hypothetical protein